MDFFPQSVSSFQGLKKAGPVCGVCFQHSWVIQSSTALTSWPREESTTAPTSPVRKQSYRKDTDLLGSHARASFWWPQTPASTAGILTTTQEGWQTDAPAQFPLGTKWTLLSLAEAAVWWGEWESGTGSSLLWGPSGVWGSFGGLGTLLHRPLALLLLLGCCEAGGSCGCLFVVSGFLVPAWLLVCQAAQPIIFIVTIVDLVIHLNLIDPHLLLSLWSWLPYL